MKPTIEELKRRRDMLRQAYTNQQKGWLSLEQIAYRVGELQRRKDTERIQRGLKGLGYE